MLRVQTIRNASLQRRGAPPQRASVGGTVRATTELTSGVVLLGLGTDTQSRVDLAHALHHRLQIRGPGFRQRCGRRTHASPRLGDIGRHRELSQNHTPNRDTYSKTRAPRPREHPPARRRIWEKQAVLPGRINNADFERKIPWIQNLYLRCRQG